MLMFQHRLLCYHRPWLCYYTTSCLSCMAPTQAPQIINNCEPRCSPGCCLWWQPVLNLLTRSEFAYTRLHPTTEPPAVPWCTKLRSTQLLLMPKHGTSSTRTKCQQHTCQAMLCRWVTMVALLLAAWSCCAALQLLCHQADGLEGPQPMCIYSQ